MKARLDRRYNLIENFILLASPNKMNVQKALNNFLELSKSDSLTVNTTEIFFILFFRMKMKTI